MDYKYENLGDEVFQQFCSSLISKEYPDLQAFPVGQPDGGRDSLAYSFDSSKKEFVVFQVKFVRNPYQITDVHKWLAETISEEVPKIAKLIPRGAKKYILVTNVKGTAHLDTGSIDKVNKVLNENIQIPAICWWRDDLNVRLEGDPLFKWSFPQILDGQSVLNSLLFGYINEHKERREHIVKAYLVDQYDLDRDVKFKQVDLRNHLLDLFTDVPFRIKKINTKNKPLKRVLSFFEVQRRYVETDEGYHIERDDVSARFGAANFLLHPVVQQQVSRILLEGGPGQGKSTISQYICQVHRARLLNKTDDLRCIPDSYKNTPLRLPLKIDLRHMADWVEKKNPYKSRISEEIFSQNWKNSLESFLIAHMIYHSQLDKFDSTDLIAIFKLTPILFVFDGFDEIANLGVRKTVIDFINKGINRLSENSKSIQIVITSRPAAFTDNVGFSVELYPHIELVDITPEVTEQYVDKWVVANGLNSIESTEIKRLVSEKLKLSHLRDLAKSPMQLAIFISLLRTRGESLPNKRTALYDSYIELFFNRESEKNTVIRDKRDLIIDIHRYIAWILHSEAEQLNSNGSMHIEELKKRLKEYLNAEGHESEIADELFDVLKERVCALVSRVQGTYEFEVQPLREYFCARYLYETAPYSPVGFEKSGTKPERFDAISRSYYWQNVVRFFAGCFDKGELPMLIAQLKELRKDQLLKYTDYPNIITSYLLSDWVFTQYPNLLNEVVSIIIDEVSVGGLSNQTSEVNGNEPIMLPTECGRIELVSECFKQLNKLPQKDFAFELIAVIKNNPHNNVERWLDYSEKLKDKHLVKWLEIAYFLEIIHKIEDIHLIKIVEADEHNKAEKLKILVKAGKFDFINRDIGYKKILLAEILSGYVVPVFNKNLLEGGLLFANLFLSGTFFEFSASSKGVYESAASYVNRPFRNRLEKHESTLDFKVLDGVDKKISDLVRNARHLLEKPIDEWSDNFDVWENFIEVCRSEMGETNSFNIMAVLASRLIPQYQIDEKYENLSDSTISLSKRVRFARLKSGNAKYWRKQLESNEDLTLKLITLLTWATPKLLLELAEELDSLVKKIDEHTYRLLVSALVRTGHVAFFSTATLKIFNAGIGKLSLSEEFLYLISYRLPLDVRAKFIHNQKFSFNSKTEVVSNFVLEYLTSIYLKNPEAKSNILAEIEKLYKASKKYVRQRRGYSRWASDYSTIPYEMAKNIMSNPNCYPGSIVSAAVKTCRSHAYKNAKAVGKIASEQKWFDS